MKWMSLLMMTMMIAKTNAMTMIKTIFHIGNANDDDYCITMIKPLGHRIFFLEKYVNNDKDNDHEDE